MTQKRCDCYRCHAHDSGHHGPYTPSEFVETFGVANEPSGSIDVDPVVIELGEKADEASAMYEAAKRASFSAERELQEARRAGSPSYMGAAPASAEARQAIDDAEAVAAMTRRSLARFRDQLEVARAAYTEAATADQNRRALEIYTADQDAQAAARRSAQQADEAGLDTKLLSRIRRKVGA